MQRDLLLTAYRDRGDVTAAPNGSVNELVNASLAAYREGRFQQSVNIAKKAIGIDPRLAEAWNNVGAGYGALHQWDSGIAAELHALEISPNFRLRKTIYAGFSPRSRG